MTTTTETLVKQAPRPLGERLVAGRVLARAKHMEGEGAKRGNLRAGTSGMMSATGDVAGGCIRRAHLRSLGVEVEVPDDSKIIMFQLGTANEDVIYQDLIQTSGPDEVILREEEIPITWLTRNGTKVTGRPDMVICRRGEGAEVPPEPIYGVEIKSIASVWTTREVLFEGIPKLPHLIQAGHYSWQLGIPFRLLYKQYGNQVVPSWAGKLFPKPGDAGSEHIVFNDKGEIKNINPFEIVYELDWSKSGHLRYRREVPSNVSETGAVDSRWTKTLVSKADIERFYEFTSEVAETGDLGPRPMTINALGKAKGYSECGYCPLKDVCDAADKSAVANRPRGAKGKSKVDYDSWLEAVRRHLESGIRVVSESD